jgi:hypothetical protein
VVTGCRWAGLRSIDGSRIVNEGAGILLGIPCTGLTEGVDGLGLVATTADGFSVRGRIEMGQAGRASINSGIAKTTIKLEVHIRCRTEADARRRAKLAIVAAVIARVARRVLSTANACQASSFVRAIRRY